MFVIVVLRVMNPGEAVGPFAHKEDAEAYAREHHSKTLWRVVELVAPVK